MRFGTNIVFKDNTVEIIENRDYDWVISRLPEDDYSEFHQEHSDRARKIHQSGVDILFNDFKRDQVPSRSTEYYQDFKRQLTLATRMCASGLILPPLRDNTYEPSYIRQLVNAVYQRSNNYLKSLWPLTNKQVAEQLLGARKHKVGFRFGLIEVFQDKIDLDFVLDNKDRLSVVTIPFTTTEGVEEADPTDREVDVYLELLDYIINGDFSGRILIPTVNHDKASFVQRRKEIKTTELV